MGYFQTWGREAPKGGRGDARRDGTKRAKDGADGETEVVESQRSVRGTSRGGANGHRRSGGGGVRSERSGGTEAGAPYDAGEAVAEQHPKVYLFSLGAFLFVGPMARAFETFGNGKLAVVLLNHRPTLLIMKSEHS